MIHVCNPRAQDNGEFQAGWNYKCVCYHIQLLSSLFIFVFLFSLSFLSFFSFFVWGFRDLQTSETETVDLSDLSGLKDILAQGTIIPGRSSGL